MSIEQTAVQLAEVERDIRALVLRHRELMTQLIDDAAHLVAGTDYRTAEHPEARPRFRVPGFMKPVERDTGMSTVLLSSTGALSQLSQPTVCPESCCRPDPHQHYADGQVVSAERRERSHRKPR
jgi:hypothetical protein